MTPQNAGQRQKALRSGAAPSALLPTSIREQADRHLTDPMEPVKEVAEEFGCSVRFLKDEARKGRLTIIRLSSQLLRIRRSEKLRYLAAKSG
jgi:hypothetical protein